MSDKVIRLNSPVNFRDKNYNVIKMIPPDTYIVKSKGGAEPAIVIHGKFLDELHKGHIK